MKKLIILSSLFLLIGFSCSKDPDPEPELIRAYCNIFHFIPGMESVLWEVDGQELLEESLYSEQIRGAVILESSSGEIIFTAKHPETKEVLISQFIPLEQDKYYIIVLLGSEDNPSILYREIDTSRPQAGNIKFRILHSLPGQNGIDIYMGGTTPDKKLVSDLSYQDLTNPFEAVDYEVRAEVVVSAHSEEFNQDSVLLSSVHNDLIVSEANYFSVIAAPTYQANDSLVTIWMYELTVE